MTILGRAPRVAATIISAESLSSTTISLGWPAFGVSTVQYQVFRNGRMVRRAGLAGQNFVETGLAAATTYTYDVYADNGKNVLTWGGRATATTLAASPLYTLTTFEEDATDATATIGGWGKIATNTSRISASTEQSRAGGKSVKFDFRYAEWGNNSTQNRTQITLGSVGGGAPLSPIFHQTTLGQDYWAGFSTFLDESWIPDNGINQELIWQFHGDSASPGNWTPPLSYSTLGPTGFLQVKGHASNVYGCAAFTGSAPPNAHQYTEDYTSDIGRWVDWVIRVNFNFTNGKVDVWKNGVHIVDFTGPTIYHCDNETLTDGPYFGAVGPYKWDWGNVATDVTSRVMFMDEIRLGGPTATYDDVKPTGSADAED